jgi:hypothetical protein
MHIQCGQRSGESGSVPKRAVHGQCGTVLLGNATSESEPKANPASRATTRCIGAVEAVEDMRQVFGSDSEPCIFNFNYDALF